MLEQVAFRLAFSVVQGMKETLSKGQFQQHDPVILANRTSQAARLAIVA